MLKEKTSFKVRPDNRMKFWTNKWCRDRALRDLFPTLYSITSSKDAWMEDVWDSGSWTQVWLGSKNGNFSVKSYYSFLVNGGMTPFPHGIVWNSWASVRVSFFAWEATWARILILDQLRRR
ncbi:hypothetical protein AAG906_013359 [Vitis piasezkii]